MSLSMVTPWWSCGERIAWLRSPCRTTSARDGGVADAAASLAGRRRPRAAGASLMRWRAAPLSSAAARRGHYDGRARRAAMLWPIEREQAAFQLLAATQPDERGECG